MKQTAVEWLVKKYEDKIGKGLTLIFESEIEQAKQMERQQIIDAAESWINADPISGKQYYNETYGK
jgi:hypothetical protein